MILNAYLNRFRSVKRSNRAMLWNAWDILTALFPVLRVFQLNNGFLVENTSWKPLETWFPRLEFQNVATRLLLSPKELPLVRPFQSHLLFIISLLLKNFLTALIHQRVIWTTSLLPTSAWHMIWFQVRQNTNITLSTSWFIKDAVDPWKQDGVEYVNEVKAKWERAHMKELRRTIGIYSFHKLKLQPFWTSQ